MATTIRERITEFAAAQGFKTLSGFEKACGFSKNTLTKDFASINTNTLVRIVESYPQLSLDWVILGRGGMTVEDSPQTEANPSPSVSIGSIQTVNIGNWGELVDLIKTISK